MGGRGEGVGFVLLLLAGELSSFKERSRILGLPWRGVTDPEAHHLPLLLFSEGTYLTVSHY